MRPSWVEIDLEAIRHNVSVIASQCAPASYCAVVKADAYGHGDVPVAEAALEAGASWLAVALVEEGIRLREAGIEAPILLLSEPPLEAVDEIASWSLTPTVYSKDFLDRIASSRRDLAVHLKVDTGMHRVGAAPDDALSLAGSIRDLPRLTLQGVWTHLAVAEEDPDFTAVQLQAFDAVLDELAEGGIEVEYVHAANTAGALEYPDSRRDLVRVGLGTYGLRPARHVGAQLDLRPAMRVVSRVSWVRRLPAGARPSYGRRRPLPADSTVATVPIGYADGYPRRMTDGGRVLIGGRSMPLAGTVTMDQIVVDAGEERVRPGDEAVLLGRQGHEAIEADEWARLVGTINYEVVCQIGPRLPRRYTEQ